MPKFAFVSGKSTHRDRIKTIRFAQERYKVMVDTHTADGLKVALEHREANLPMIVLETAQPAKFEETISEALGTEPVRPADLKGIESLPQRVVVMAPDVAAIKQFIVERV
jgi:threonine synthase